MLDKSVRVRSTGLWPNLILDHWFKSPWIFNVESVIQDLNRQQVVKRPSSNSFPGFVLKTEVVTCGNFNLSAKDPFNFHENKILKCS